MTTPSRWQEIDRIFAEALEREPSARAEYLDNACAADQSLREEVDSLLAHDVPDTLVSGGAVHEATRLLDKNAAALPTKSIGRYKIIRTLGTGGMGRIYLGLDGQLHRPVAIKLLSNYNATEEERMRRFRLEALAASALNHPNILTIYEIGEFEGTSFITTEFIDGMTLRARMKAGPIPLELALDIAIQTASALSAAHAAGIIHRDIKPENVMVRADGLAKVLDFGIAKFTQPHGDEKSGVVETVPGRIIGTTAYMSPEQARGTSIDPRSDLWSLGVILYEMIASRAPFPGETPADVIAAVLEREPPPLKVEGPSVLQPIVFKALEKHPNDRYQTADELLADLKQAKRELESSFGVLSSDSSKSAEADKVPASPAGGATTSETRPTFLSVPANHLEWIRYHKFAAILILIMLLTAIAAFLGYRSRLASSQPIQSIAVMPFANEGGNIETEYLSDGISESLINSLSKLPGVRVIARSSTFQYKGKKTSAEEVAAALGVETILTGRVLQRGDNLLISVELVNARDRTQLWGEQYNRKAGDLLQIQAEISKEIADRLRLRLTPAEQQRLNERATVDARAYQLYLKGRYFWNKKTAEGHQKSIVYFNEAIDRDPNSALAYAGLADVYYSLPFDSDARPRDAFPKAKAAALRALEIDDKLAEAHTSLASVKFMYDWDFAGAEREFKLAISLNPNYSIVHQRYSRYLSAVERHQEAVQEARLALELDPLSLIASANLGQTIFFARQYDQAIEQLRTLLEMDPNFWVAHLFSGKAYTQKGMHAQALDELKKAREFSGFKGGSSSAISLMGYDYAVSGRRAESEQILRDLDELSKQKYVPPYHIAVVYAGLGDKNQAFDWLEKAYQDRNQFMNLLKAEPNFDSLRSDQRFQDLVRRVGF